MEYREQGAKKSEGKLLETVIPGVDFKGGDLKGVGPLAAADDKVGVMIWRFNVQY